MKKFPIIGTGAVGGFCAIKLMQAGFDVHCLLGGDYAFVKQNGLSLVSQNQTITLPINAYQSVGDMPQCDVIIVALKSTANSILEDLLPKIMHEKSIVVILQNGIGVENEIAQFIQPEKIIGAMIILKVTKISPGVIKHFSFCDIEFAQYFTNQKKHEITKSVEALSAIFIKAGFKSETMPHLPTIRWKKLAANIAISGLSVVLNASTKELAQNPASYALLVALTQEVINTAKKCDAQIPDDFYQFRLHKFEQFKTMEDSNSSMLDDYREKKPLELHAIYENTINIAKKNNIAMPLTEMLYQQLIYLNAKNLRGDVVRVLRLG